MPDSCQFVRAWSVSLVNTIAYITSIIFIIGFFSIADVLKLVKILQVITLTDCEALFICICINVFRRLVLVCTRVQSPKAHCTFAGFTLVAIQLMLEKLGYFDITGLFLAIMILFLELALTTTHTRGSLISKLRVRVPTSQVHPRTEPVSEASGSENTSRITAWIVDIEPEKDPEQCCVCLQDMTGVQSTPNSDRRVCQLKCNHMFHIECITKWISVKNTCPVCRA